MVYFVPTEHLETPLPYNEWTGEEYLIEGEYSVLEIDEAKSVGVRPYVGLVYVVERKGRPGKQFACLNVIPAKDLKIRQPHPLHPVFRRGENSHTNTEQPLEGEDKP